MSLLNFRTGPRGVGTDVMDPVGMACGRRGSRPEHVKGFGV